MSLFNQLMWGHGGQMWCSAVSWNRSPKMDLRLVLAVAALPPAPAAPVGGKGFEFWTNSLAQEKQEGNG